jgi:putative FmdB family regulatory protein
MPIYAYRCESCGHEKDVLRKLSDAPLTQCPACGKDTFSKQVTAAGFQLKGSGWYVTDFRGGKNGGANASNASNTAAKSEDGASGADNSAASKPAESAGAASAPASDAAPKANGASSTSAAPSGAA